MINKNNAQIQITRKHSQKGSCVTQLGEIIKDQKSNIKYAKPN
jgi:hypothetical protein